MDCAVVHRKVTLCCVVTVAFLAWAAHLRGCLLSGFCSAVQLVLGGGQLYPVDSESVVRMIADVVVD